MINVISDINPKKRFRQSFGNTQNSVQQPLNYADKFLSELEKINKKEQNGSFFTKYFWSTTALSLSAIPVLGYELGAFFRIRKMKKDGLKIEVDALKKSFKSKFKYVFFGGIALFAGLEALFNSFNEKNYKKLENNFKNINTLTNAQLSGAFRSGYVGAYCTSSSGHIRVNRNIMNDPITNRSMTKLLKHELVHAHQFEMIARSKDGIKKLNYANIMNVINIAQKNPKTIEEFIQIHKDIQNDKTGKYDNKEITILGEKYNFKRYIEAINIILTNKNATYNDIPIIINENHYKKVIEEKGQLTPEEEKKANEYYDALVNYQLPKYPLDAYNPFSKYRNNILEQEAYKENPSLLMKLFGKN